MPSDSGRLLLAPHLGPWPPLGPEAELEAAAPAGPRFYLSWPGWEDFLIKRLGRKPDPAGPAPLWLPPSPDNLSLAALDQLADRAGREGAGLWPLLVSPAENSAALAAAILRPAPSPAPRPLLSDQAYLALWTLAEHQAAAGAALWAETARRERAMWAALKGEEDSPDPPLPESLSGPEPGRATYAWRCWRRLAASLLRPGDLILPTTPEEF